MPADEEGSITQLIGKLKEGNGDAAQGLWEAYFARMVAVARSSLKGRRKDASEDEEDAALSAFLSFSEGAPKGEFRGLGSREQLWRLLVVITKRKVSRQGQRLRAVKRGQGHVVGETCAFDAVDESKPMGLDQIPGDEPTPEFIVMTNETLQEYLDMLEDGELREVAIMTLKGYDNKEIAETLGCSSRTIARRRDLIRNTWVSMIPEA